MTSITAYKRLKKSFPQYEFHVTTGSNSSYFNATIYVTREFNRLDNCIVQADSFDEKDPVAVCFKKIMQQLTQQ